MTGRLRPRSAHATLPADAIPSQGRNDDQSGIALLIVLLTITLLTIVVIEFTDFTQVETHLAFSARNALQATYLARSGVNVAEALVIVDQQITPGNDSLQDVWAKPFPPLPIGDGTVAFRVRDEARFLNLNDMFSKDGYKLDDKVEVFTRLFTVLGIDQRILMAIVDWIDSNQDPEVTPPGAEQPYYLGLTPPQNVRNGPLLTLRELLLVRGVTPTVLARLESFVTVLPPYGLRVNINTAPAEVLYALSEGMLADPGVVDRLIASRDTEAFTSVSQTSLAAVTGLPDALLTNAAFLRPDSNYFRIEAVGEINDVRRGIVELVKRDGKRLTRVTWTPSSATLALTSQLPSDFLATLPLLGDH
jgi:general secretion pathway protein K